ncbi:hypothetical protein A3C18_00360 [Candidatus Kaiserbacteria bacterium RIFCSPHIGHO2_02_FULL_54_11b]|uniref:Uncharacterized protein n=2 Tax=Candidatus Kaiseribacteriota TaxID=1752734 RepID=A0A1F6CLF7_9BACT|nr:MAG: hypothetical protein A2704_05995 [Candidatus Kaiserbacteria bacterium RIFCSPHIGHO2_01_FULL_54_36b]OGG64317.1 MAG: hypothetical protein A3C18_00360 [Candidatus Kaiserbacteria bacterium RIFCSPHIGHO2_02_FULL_54_11b]
MRINDVFVPVRILEAHRTRLLIPVLTGEGMTEMLNHVARDKAYKKLDALGRLCLAREMLVSVTASVQDLVTHELIDVKRGKLVLREAAAWLIGYIKPLLKRLQK